MLSFNIGTRSRIESFLSSGPIFLPKIPDGPYWKFECGERPGVKGVVPLARSDVTPSFVTPSYNP